MDRRIRRLGLRHHARECSEVGDAMTINPLPFIICAVLGIFGWLAGGPVVAAVLVGLWLSYVVFYNVFIGP